MDAKYYNVELFNKDDEYAGAIYSVEVENPAWFNDVLDDAITDFIWDGIQTECYDVQDVIITCPDEFIVDSDENEILVTCFDYNGYTQEYKVMATVLEAA